MSLTSDTNIFENESFLEPFRIGKRSSLHRSLPQECRPAKSFKKSLSETPFDVNVKQHPYTLTSQKRYGMVYHQIKFELVPEDIILAGRNVGGEGDSINRNGRFIHFDRFVVSSQIRAANKVNSDIHAQSSNPVEDEQFKSNSILQKDILFKTDACTVSSLLLILNPTIRNITIRLDFLGDVVVTRIWPFVLWNKY